VILYHGTSIASWERIRASGSILPRSVTSALTRWEAHPSAIDKVYLTSCYAPYFAMVAAMEDGSSAVILRVDATELHRCPDEDFLEACSRECRPEDCPAEMSEATEWFRERLDWFAHLADDSLRVLGTCCVDEVPLDRVTGAVELSPPGSIVLWCDPTITPLNHLILGGRYRDVSARLFDRAWHPDVDHSTTRKIVEISFQNALLSEKK